MTSPVKSPRNVLLICTDHWPGFLLRCAGHPSVITPTLDQLCSLGTRFSQAYSACPVCVAARRSLMTGLTARTHGDRAFNERLPMPPVPTLAQCFRDGGYQAFAVGKLHAFPVRSRLGFDEVINIEEGRRHLGAGADDWESYLAERGFFGQEYAAGGGNNEYVIQPWHLPEECHPTNWIARETCRMIKRLDPQKPAFLYASFTAPHPPLWTLPGILESYRDIPIDEPVRGDWVDLWEKPPFKWRSYFSGDTLRSAGAIEIQNVRRAFYSVITHVDRQIRVILGTLREQGLLENTVIAFTSDHGDMLGDHGLWAKSFMYEPSMHVPLLVAPAENQVDAARGRVDNRLAELRDIMPTLLDLAGLPIPESVEGFSLFSEHRRRHLYGEHGEGVRATRMVRDERFKLIYYAEGNRFQLFDLSEDPRECMDLQGDPAHKATLRHLQNILTAELYGDDLPWHREGQWVGLPEEPSSADPLNFSLTGQRGIRFP